MTYRIRGLDPAQFAPLTALDNASLGSRGVSRVTADDAPGYPCRITLDDAEAGESLLLLNHVSHRGGPYHASHAIFVREGIDEAATYVDRIPPALDRRTLSLRAFDKDGMMVDASLVGPGEADPEVRRILAMAQVDHIDAHNAVRGCFAARIERHSPEDAGV